MILHEMSHRFPPHSGRCQFFEWISFNIKLSNMASCCPAAVCKQIARGGQKLFELGVLILQRLQLPSIAHIHTPKRPFQLKIVALPMACLRHRSATVTLLSCSRNIPMMQPARHREKAGKL
jgi:hypothetical protein